MLRKYNFVLLVVQANSSVFKGAKSSVSAPPAPTIPPAIQNLNVSKLVMSGSPIIRLAGISGAAAVILGAYGAHSKLITSTIYSLLVKALEIFFFFFSILHF